MKFFLLLAIVGAALAIDWSDCGSKDTKGKITSLTAKPDPPVKGNNNTIGGKGVVLMDVDKASFELVIKLDGLKIADEKGDACAPKTVKLPLDAGSVYYPGLDCPLKNNSSVDVYLYVSLSKVAPPGKVESTLTATAAGGPQLLCAVVDFKI
jgi:hypothetical protein